jgi:hypothetical protein
MAVRLIKRMQTHNRNSLLVFVFNVLKRTNLPIRGKCYKKRHKCFSNKNRTPAPPTDRNSISQYFILQEKQDFTELHYGVISRAAQKGIAQ